MNTRNNHQNQSANRATRRHGAKVKAAKLAPSPLFCSMFGRHIDSLDLVEQLNLASEAVNQWDLVFADIDLDSIPDHIY
jgi:hypothetical protein